MSTTTHINTYNPIVPNSITPSNPNGKGEIIWWNQTNEAIQIKIPESIRSGNADSDGEPTDDPDTITKWLSDKFL